MQKQFGLGIFPKSDETASRKHVIGLARLERKNAKQGHLKLWANNGETSLERYHTIDTNGHLISLEKELLRAIRQNQSGLPLKVIDITFGTGKQWVNFLIKHKLELGKHLELHGAAFTTIPVVEELKGNVKACLASKLYKKFPANYFDFVVSNAGPYHELRANIENAIHITKQNGEIMLSHGDRVIIPENDIVQEIGIRSGYVRLKKLRTT